MLFVSNKMAHSYIIIILLSLFATVLTVAPPNPSDLRAFIVKAQDDRISLVQLVNNKVDAELPLFNTTDVQHVEYDMRHNCIFYATSDQIIRESLSGNEPPEWLVSYGATQIEGLAYDWMSQVLYFTDADRYKIEAINVSNIDALSVNRLRSTIYQGDEHSIPKRIAVHPTRGYLYWISASVADSNAQTIVRIGLDGSNERKLIADIQIQKPIEIDIDYDADRVYWNDDELNQIASSDLDGNDVRIHSLYNDHSPITEISVHKSQIYYKESYYGNAQSDINAVNKGTSKLLLNNKNLEYNNSFICLVGKQNATRIQEDLKKLKTFRVYGSDSQLGANACGSGTHNCSDLCISTPDGKFKCICPDGLTLNDSGECYCPISQNPFECLKRNRTCDDDFQCASNGKCIER